MNRVFRLFFQEEENKRSIQWMKMLHIALGLVGAALFFIAWGSGGSIAWAMVAFGLMHLLGGIENLLLKQKAATSLLLSISFFALSYSLI
ncbi:hypothetical protein [Bacillus sp. KH172YL63]|uniref:hypothetical protein n=1 Tax=Bacillus sp. KH172YL63 TaxID=2709784 RepID=UPI0013E443AA|nr:hypothetical protein [Bacillus sp. KH172YL63]BCB04220.1 hypothetical protein KH172YL63_23530 [Bacillus sp. KH172YL63]